MHSFWNKELVLRENIIEDISSSPIKELTINDYSPMPFKLPNEFEWVELDLNCENDLNDLYIFLSQHYLEEDDEIYRVNYSKELLKWSLMPPKYESTWHIGIRVSSNKKLVAFISAIPANINISNKVTKMVEINYLCINKKLRNKRLAPVLIKEISRRAARKEYFQAIYTSGKHFQKELSKMCYFHRSINVQKLVDIEFQSIKPKMTMKLMKRLYSLPNKPTINMRLMEEKDLSEVCVLFKSYISQFQVYPILNEEEFKHWFLPRNNVLYSYVVINENKITDIISFYCLPSKVVKHSSKHNEMKSAFSFYNISTKTSYKNLIENALIIANINNFDIYTCLDIMNNETIFKDLKFGKASGNLFLYLYNWQSPILKPKEVGIVLI